MQRVSQAGYPPPPPTLRNAPTEGFWRCTASAEFGLHVRSLHRRAIDLMCGCTFHAREITEGEFGAVPPCGHTVRFFGLEEVLPDQLPTRARSSDRERCRLVLTEWVATADPRRLASTDRFTREVLARTIPEAITTVGAAYALLWYADPAGAIDFLARSVEARLNAQTCQDCEQPIAPEWLKVLRLCSQQDLRCSACHRRRVVSALSRPAAEMAVARA